MGIDNEYALLGHCLNNSRVVSQHYLHEKLFQNNSTRKIYRAIVKIMDVDGTIPDLVSLRDEDIQKDELLKLSEQGFSGTPKFHYSKIINDYKMLGITAIKNVAENCNDKPDEVLQKISEMISKITKVSDVDSLVNIKELLIPYMNEIEERFKNKGQLPGITTGFDKLDSYTLGLQKKQMIVVGARPSDGKTAVMLNMALACSKKGHKPCILNLESNNTEMITRFISQIAAVNGQKISAGMVTGDEFTKIVDACTDLSRNDIFMYDSPNISLTELIARARQAVNMYKCDIIFIDYIQIIRNTGNFGSKREKVEDVSIRLKELARELDIPVVVMAQLNRNAANTMPTVSEFKESGQIEQDADIAILLYHERDKDSQETFKPIKNSWFIIDKNRNGAKANIPVLFKGEYVKFMEKEYYHE